MMDARCSHYSSFGSPEGLEYGSPDRCSNMTQCSDSEIAPTGVDTDEDEGLYKKALKDYQKLLEEENDEEEEEITDEQASCVEKLLHNAYYGYFMSVMILANVVCFMLQADY